MPNAQQRISIQTVAVVVDPAFWIDPARNSLHHFGDLVFPVLHPGKVAKRCIWSEKIEKRILQLHLGRLAPQCGTASSPVKLPKTAWKLAKLQTPAFRDGAD